MLRSDRRWRGRGGQFRATFNKAFVKHSLVLTTPSAPFRKGSFFFVAQPPLLFEEGRPLLFEEGNQLLESDHYRFHCYSPLVLVSRATQFIRMSSLAGQSSAGTMRLAIQTGEALTLT